MYLHTYVVYTTYISLNFNLFMFLMCMVITGATWTSRRTQKKCVSTLKTNASYLSFHMTTAKNWKKNCAHKILKKKMHKKRRTAEKIGKLFMRICNLFQYSALRLCGYALCCFQHERYFFFCFASSLLNSNCGVFYTTSKELVSNDDDRESVKHNNASRNTHHFEREK